VAQIADLSNALRAFADAVSRLVLTGRADGSPAAVDEADQSMRGFGATRPGLEASLTPLLLLVHATDHLRGMAAAVDADGVVLSVVSLLRPALESAGLAHYVLEPDIRTQERVRRWANVRLGSYVEQLRLIGPEDRRGEEALKLAHKIYWMRQHAPRHGFVAKTAKRRGTFEPATWVEPPLPSGQSLIHDLLDDVPGDTGKTLHRMTSAVVHGQFHGVLPFLSEAMSHREDDADVAHVALHVTLPGLAVWTGPAVWGVQRCVDRAVAYYGWPQDDWKRASMDALLCWRAWLGDWTADAAG
jgi:hypothetical protein